MTIYDHLVERQGELLTEIVETDDLPGPDVVWHGLYRFEPVWRPKHKEVMDETGLAHDAMDAIYWAYVEDAEREESMYFDVPGSPTDELPDDWIVDRP